MEEIYALLKKCFVWVSEMETFWEMTWREVKEDEKDHEEIFVFFVYYLFFVYILFLAAYEYVLVSFHQSK